MPNGHSYPLFSETIRALGGSISALQEVVPQSGLLKAGLRALALRSIASTESNSGWMEREALRLHTLTLQQTAKVLMGSRARDLELIGATRILSFYEVSTLSQLSIHIRRANNLRKALYGGETGSTMTHFLGWKAHHSGDLAITLSKHPSFFATGRAHRLFVDGRFNHVRGSLFFWLFPGADFWTRPSVLCVCERPALLATQIG